ncbi:fucolectin-4-like [Eleutherodactylus coqui]|uniref:fucolectin-4-like n=1 Tax=Eleutherodactylus coqui TaxID=57060 RepID=UPI003462C9CA
MKRLPEVEPPIVPHIPSLNMNSLLTITLFWLLSGTTAQNYKNVALRGRATQSSVLFIPEWGYLAGAINAIDGNVDQDYKHGSCSSTNNEDSAWWKVDLLEPHKISHIIITNRGDCCREQLNGALILVGNSAENNGNNNPRCAEIKDMPRGSTQTFKCYGMIGQFVNIILPGKRDHLQLCEVQVFGVPVNSSPN